MTASTAPTSSSPSLRSQPLKLAQTVGYFLAFIVLGMSTSSIGPTLGGLAEHTGSTLAQVSVLFTARAFGYMLGSLLGGRLYDRIKGHPVIAVGYVLMAVMLALTPVISQLWLLSLVLVVLSIADGVVDVGCNTLLAWAHGGNLGVVMNALHFFFGVGALIAPVLAAQVIASTGGVSWVYWIIAALALIPAVLHLRIPSPVAVHHIASDSGKPREDLRLTVIVALFFVAIVAMEATFAGWIASYAVAVDFGDAARAAVLTSVFWGGFTVARLLSIPLATRLSVRAMLTINLVICVAAAVLMLLSKATPALVAGSFGVGFGVAPLFPTMISYAETRMAITGKVTSLFLVGSSIGGMTVPLLIGQVFEPIGPTTMVWAVLACATLAAAVFVIVQLRPKAS